VYRDRGPRRDPQAACIGWHPERIRVAPPDLAHPRRLLARGRRGSHRAGSAQLDSAMATRHIWGDASLLLVLDRAVRAVQLTIGLLARGLDARSRGQADVPLGCRPAVRQPSPSALKGGGPRYGPLGDVAATEQIRSEAPIIAVCAAFSPRAGPSQAERQDGGASDVKAGVRSGPLGSRQRQAISRFRRLLCCARQSDRQAIDRSIDRDPDANRGTTIFGNDSQIARLGKPR
jgi:hypothetical protein